MAKKVPAPRGPSESAACEHPETRRRGPYTVPMPKGKFTYYQVLCAKGCKRWLYNVDERGKRL